MWTLYEKILRSASIEGTPSPSPSPESSPAPPSPSPEPAAPNSIVGNAPAGDPPADPPADTPKESAAPEPFALDKLTLPENFVIPEDVGKQFSEVATKYGLTTEAAQDLVSLYATEAQKQANASYEAYERLNTEWVDSIRADKEVGGEKLDANLAKIGKFLGDPKFVDPAFKEALNLTGAGNHPAVFKTMLKIAEALSEGGPVGGSPPASARPASIAEALYPNNPKG